MMDKCRKMCEINEDWKWSPPHLKCFLFGPQKFNFFEETPVQNN